MVKWAQGVLQAAHQPHADLALLATLEEITRLAAEVQMKHEFLIVLMRERMTSERVTLKRIADAANTSTAIVRDLAVEAVRDAAAGKFGVLGFMDEQIATFKAGGVR